MAALAPLAAVAPLALAPAPPIPEACLGTPPDAAAPDVYLEPALEAAGLFLGWG